MLLRNLTPEETAYVPGSGQVPIGVQALLDRIADSFHARDIFYQQSIVNAGLSHTPAPLPSAGWLLLVGPASLLRVAKNRKMARGK